MGVFGLVFFFWPHCIIDNFNIVEFLKVHPWQCMLDVGLIYASMALKALIRFVNFILLNDNSR